MTIITDLRIALTLLKRGEKMPAKIHTILFVLLIVIVLACGCQSEKTIEHSASDYNKETDDQPFWNGTKTAASTKYGYYFMINQRLYLYDHVSRELTPLCGRTDCTHKGDDCNACFENFIEYIGYYKEHLYMVGRGEEKRELYLYQVTADGSQRKKLCKLGRLDDDCESYSFLVAVHRGYFYYSILPFQRLPVERSVTACRISLTDGNYEKEEFYRKEGLDAAICGFWAYDNKILFSSSHLTSAEESQEIGSCCYYDTEKEEVVEDVVTGDDADMDAVYAAGDDIYFCKDGEFFSISTKDGSKKEYETEIFENERSIISYDFTDLYSLDNEAGILQVFDTNAFEKKKEIEWGKKWWMLFGDEKLLFAIDYEDSSLLVYDKSQDGSWERVDFGRWE